ncbi:MAG: acylphosphatase [Patescibacteria group bacterium]|nr:acylphosphatase [Patescibacteria group bacterium]
MLVQKHLYIKGDVIGVGFRAWAKIQAKMIGVTGWIRNIYDRPDIFGDNGGVEAVIQGEEEKVKRMIEVLKIGSPVSRVDEIEIHSQTPREIFEDFEIRK